MPLNPAFQIRPVTSLTRSRVNSALDATSGNASSGDPFLDQEPALASSTRDHILAVRMRAQAS